MLQGHCHSGINPHLPFLQTGDGALDCIPLGSGRIGDAADV